MHFFQTKQQVFDSSVSFPPEEKIFISERVLVSALVSLLPKVCSSVASVEEQLRDQETMLPWSGLSVGTGSSSNTPEETDDVDNSNVDASSSMRAVPGAGAAASPSPTEDGEGRPQAGEVKQADSSSEACASLEAAQDGKCVEV